MSLQMSVVMEDSNTVMSLFCTHRNPTYTFNCFIFTQISGWKKKSPISSSAERDCMKRSLTVAVRCAFFFFFWLVCSGWCWNELALSSTQQLMLQRSSQKVCLWEEKLNLGLAFVQHLLGDGEGSWFFVPWRNLLCSHDCSISIPTCKKKKSLSYIPFHQFP